MFSYFKIEITDATHQAENEISFFVCYVRTVKFTTISFLIDVCRLKWHGHKQFHYIQNYNKLICKSFVTMSVQCCTRAGFCPSGAPFIKFSIRVIAHWTSNILLLEVYLRIGKGVSRLGNWYGNCMLNHLFLIPSVPLVLHCFCTCFGITIDVFEIVDLNIWRCL